MRMDQVITALIYLAAVFVVLLLAKWAYDMTHRRFVLRAELLENDNFALALSVIGYYLGVVLALGGILTGPAAVWWVDDVLDIFFWGICAIVLQNLSGLFNDKLVLRKFDNQKEIIEDRNAGTGIVEAGNYIATGLIIAGAISGEGGDLMTALAFWIFGQAALVIASRIYDLITPYDIHQEIQNDNIAVGVAFSGALIAIGLIVQVSIAGDFVSWPANLSQFAVYLAFGLLSLPLMRFLTDKLLLPGARLTDELVNQEKPNIGAGAIEAFSYVAAALLFSWAI